MMKALWAWWRRERWARKKAACRDLWAFVLREVDYDLDEYQAIREELRAWRARGARRRREARENVP